MIGKQQEELIMKNLIKTTIAALTLAMVSTLSYGEERKTVDELFPIASQKQIMDKCLREKGYPFIVCSCIVEGFKYAVEKHQVRIDDKNLTQQQLIDVITDADQHAVECAAENSSNNPKQKS
jgi:hypothetical protein